MELDDVTSIIGALDNIQRVHEFNQSFVALLDDVDSPEEILRPEHDEPWEAGVQRRRQLRESLRDHEPA